MGAKTETASRERMRILWHRRISFINETSRRRNSLPVYFAKRTFPGFNTTLDSSLQPRGTDRGRPKEKRKRKIKNLGFQILLFSLRVLEREIDGEAVSSGHGEGKVVVFLLFIILYYFIKSIKKYFANVDWNTLRHLFTFGVCSCTGIWEARN